METITLQIPNVEIEPFKKMVKKLEKKVSFIQVKFGDKYKKLYHHVERDIDGYCYTVKMWHEVIDVTVEMDTINDWVLLATYKDGLEFVANPTKELILQNPEHGKEYRKCDACGHWCKNSFIVYNTKTGEELQVGKECLKTFGLNGISFVYDFTKELYRMIDCYCSFSDEDSMFPIWKGDKDTYAFSSCKTTDLLKAAKAYYNENKVWKKGYYVGKTYYKSESNDRIQANLISENFDGNDEYINKVIEHVKGLQGNSEFSCDMITMVNNFYTAPSYAAHAYFAVKSYEESLKAKEINISRFKVGLQVHVQGKVIRKELLETMYGSVYKYTIQANGLLFERTGSIQVSEDKTVNFYALIKNVKGLTIVLDRATKNPKKGIEILNI